jgi:hypothetical protein
MFAQLTLRLVEQLKRAKLADTYHMNIPRLCEAHRGFRALQSAQTSGGTVKHEDNGICQGPYRFQVSPPIPAEHAGSSRE